MLNALLGSFDASDDRKGLLFETLVFNQLTHSAWALGEEPSVSFYRTEAGSEVDFVVERLGF